MKYVEILKLQKDGSQKVVVTCSLRDGKISLSGDENICRNLETRGIPIPPNNILYPKDGEVFLQQLQATFKSGYLNATGVMER